MNRFALCWISMALMVVIHENGTGLLFADENEGEIVATEALHNIPLGDVSGKKPADDWTTAQEAASEIHSLLRAKKLGAAAEAIVKAESKWPKTIALLDAHMTLVLALVDKDLTAAKQRLESIRSSVENETGQRPRYFFFGVTMIAKAVARTGEVEEALAMLDDLEQIKLSGGSITHIALSARASILLQAGRQSDVDSLFQSEIDRCFNDATASAGSDFMPLVMVTETAVQQLSEPSKELVARIAKVNEWMESRVNSDHATLQDLSAYVSLKITTAKSLAERNPDSASQLLNDLELKLDQFETDIDSEQMQLKGLASQIRSTLNQIAYIKARVELIGTPAPEIDAQHFVHGDAVTLAGLKGKVVLLDFWAVWCNSCIASFPHLKQLHDTRAKEGLVILGVTQFYGMAWNEASASIVQDATPTIEKELKMLERFRQHHQLPFSFAVTARNSDTSRQYAVRDTPQWVVIDQEGVIRLIEVGGSEKAVKSVDAMIAKLLDNPKS